MDVVARPPPWPHGLHARNAASKVKGVVPANRDAEELAGGAFVSSSFSPSTAQGALQPGAGPCELDGTWATSTAARATTISTEQVAVGRLAVR